MGFVASFRQILACGGVLLIGVAGLLLWGGNPQAEAKPGTPLAIFWDWSAGTNTSGAHRLTLTVKARVAMRYAEMRFTTDGSSRAVFGSMNWQGPLAAGERITRTLWVQPSARRSLKATVEGITVSDVHVYQVLNLDKAVAPIDESQQKPRTPGTFGFADAPAGSGGLRELPGR